MTLYSVRLHEEDNYKFHTYLLEANNENHAKNLAEAKWYEKHALKIKESATEVWEVEIDFSNRDNPSVRQN